MTDWDRVSEELRKPLNPANVKSRGEGNMTFEYIEAWYAQDTANQIFGHGGWSQEVISVSCASSMEGVVGKDKKPGWLVCYTATVRITVGGVIREDCGAGQGANADLGAAHEKAIKDAISDAVKRALKSFGYRFGLALYDKERAHVGVPEPSQEERERNAGDFTSKFIREIASADTVADVGALWERDEARLSALEQRYPGYYERVLDAYGDKMRQLDDKIQQSEDDQ